MSRNILAPGVHYSMRNGAHLLYCWEARQVLWEDAAPHQMQTELLSTEFRNHVSARLQISHTQFSQSLVRGHHSPINCWRQGPGQWWLNSLLTTVHAVITCVCILFLNSGSVHVSLCCSVCWYCLKWQSYSRDFVLQWLPYVWTEPTKDKVAPSNISGALSSWLW